MGVGIYRVNLERVPLGADRKIQSTKDRKIQTMNTPKAVIDTIAALKAERGPLGARIDAIDLAIDNLSRVYGLHGTPQPLPLNVERRKTRRVWPTKEKAADATKVDTASAERCETLLSIIGKAQNGATIADLRKATPRMDGKDRSNSLYVLKAKGRIRRAGNTWVAAA